MFLGVWSPEFCVAQNTPCICAPTRRKAQEQNGQHLPEHCSAEDGVMDNSSDGHGGAAGDSGDTIASREESFQPRMGGGTSSLSSDGVTSRGCGRAQA